VPVEHLDAPPRAGGDGLVVTNAHVVRGKRTVVEFPSGRYERANLIARDADWRSSLRSKIARNKHRLYRDSACIAALEDFLAAQAQGSAPS